jgi:hypothetical protein
MVPETNILWVSHAPPREGRPARWAAKAVRVAMLVYLLPAIAVVFVVGGILALACKGVALLEYLVKPSLHRAGPTPASWSSAPGRDLIGRDTAPASTHPTDCERISNEG